MPLQCLVVIFLSGPLAIVFSRRGVIGGVASAMLLYAGLLLSTYLFLALGKGTASIRSSPRGFRMRSSSSSASCCSTSAARIASSNCAGGSREEDEGGWRMMNEHGLLRRPPLSPRIRPCILPPSMNPRLVHPTSRRPLRRHRPALRGRRVFLHAALLRQGRLPARRPQRSRVQGAQRQRPALLDVARRSSSRHRRPRRKRSASRPPRICCGATWRSNRRNTRPRATSSPRCSSARSCSRKSRRARRRIRDAHLRAHQDRRSLRRSPIRSSGSTRLEQVQQEVGGAPFAE